MRHGDVLRLSSLHHTNLLSAVCSSGITRKDCKVAFYKDWNSVTIHYNDAQGRSDLPCNKYCPNSPNQQEYRATINHKQEANIRCLWESLSADRKRTYSLCELLVAHIFQENNRLGRRLWQFSSCSHHHKSVSLELVWAVSAAMAFGRASLWCACGTSLTVSLLKSVSSWQNESLVLASCCKQT